MKRLITWLAVLALTVFLVLPVHAAQPNSGILVDGRELTFDVQPQVVDGVLMIPVRSVAEAMNGQVSWNDETQSATIVAGDRTVVFTVGKTAAVLDGRQIDLGAAVVFQDNRTLVPASFLITFFGERLKITNPAVRDPKAVELILKSSEATPKNADMVMHQNARISDGAMSFEIAMDLQGQIRGTELLMTTRMDSMMLPPEAGDISIALKGGTQYVKFGPMPWQAVPGEVNIEELIEQVSAAQQLIEADVVENLILEAHLGETRTEDGRSLQDVFVTYDVDALMGLVDALLPDGAEDLDGVTITIERLNSVVTIDLATGALVKQKNDMAIVMTAEGRSMRMELQQEGTITPNDTPIVWPADLPEGAPAEETPAPEAAPEEVPESAPGN